MGAYDKQQGSDDSITQKHEPNSAKMTLNESKSLSNASDVLSFFVLLMVLFFIFREWNLSKKTVIFGSDF